MSNDYIVLFDKNNQPYLAHWGNAWKNRPHKYLLKIGKGSSARYFYTQAEIDAYNKRAYGGSVSPKKLYQNTKKAVRVNKRNLNKAKSELKSSERQLNRVNDRLRSARNSGNSVKTAKAQKAATDTNRKILNSSVKVTQKKKQYDRSVKQLEALKKKTADQKIKSISVSDALKTGKNKIKSISNNIKNKTLSAITTQEANAKQRKIYKEGAKEQKKKDKEVASSSNSVNKIKSISNNIKNKTLSAITTQEANAKQRKIYKEGAKEQKEKEKTNKKASERIKDAVGVDEKEKLDNAISKLKKTRPFSLDFYKAYDDVQSAREDYLKTPLGKYNTYKDTKITKKEAAIQEKMLKDPEVVSARRERESALKKYNEAEQKFFDANDVELRKSMGETNYNKMVDDLRRKYESAQQKLESAEREVENAEKKYRK